MAYLITFLDNTTFLGGEPNDSKWNTMPQKPIVKLEYGMVKRKVILEGYEGYNHIVERVACLSHKGKERISKVILMTRKGRDVMSLIFDTIRGKVTSNVSIFGKEYHNKPVTGWKLGIKGGKSKSQII